MIQMATHSRPHFSAPRFSVIGLGVISILLATTACTQPPAKIVYKGQNIYGPDKVVKVASNVYRAAPKTSSATAPVTYQASHAAPTSSMVSTETQQTASIQSIGVSDLPPPSATSNSQPAPMTLAVNDVPKKEPIKEEPAKVAITSPKPVNLWTKEPREVASVGKVSPATPGILDQSVKHTQSVGYMWPVSSKKVLNSFGPKAGGRVSDGMDIASASGEPVWASADGEVVFIGDELKGYGNMVLIKHLDGKTTTYAHLSRAAVDKYDRVKQGDIIGYVGATGNVRDPQLYFAINEGKVPVDPQKYLTHSVAGL
jgi:murein DD-endopeptidase MepM/ murein hydrolase activator NlpD